MEKSLKNNLLGVFYIYMAFRELLNDTFGI